LAPELLFIQNYAPGIWSHTWSLAIEEHFYLLLAVVISMLARQGGPNPFRALPRWIVIGCTAILGLRILTWMGHLQITAYSSVFPSHLRIDSLMVGVLVSYYHCFHREVLVNWMRGAGRWVGPASAALLAPIVILTREDPFMVTVGFSMVAWGFALLLVAVPYPMKPVALTSRWARAMAGLGRISYAFYLWQAPVLIAGYKLNLPSILVLILTFGISLILAIVTTQLIENPFLRLRERFVSGRCENAAKAA
jgi:peptidoglycan/LPS O-acetylase OafA/YrhL